MIATRRLSSPKTWAMVAAAAWASNAYGETYVGEAVFPTVIFSQTTYPSDPETGSQIEVTCEGTSDVRFSEMRVATSPPSITFTYESTRTNVTGDPRFCTDSQGSFPFEVANVSATDDGVVGQNNAGTLFFDLLFYANDAELRGTVTQTNGFDGQQIGEATLLLEAIPIEELLNNLANAILATNLQAGISNALDAKLETALRALDDSNDQNDGAALNSMYAFCNSVSAQRGGKLTEAQADSLLDAANEVINSLDEFAAPCE